MTSHPSLRWLDHRPWPIPPERWRWRQTWHDLLFMHWSVPADALRALLPPGLELDLHEGEAWLGVVPFRMSGIAHRGLPALPGLAAFPELNVRTYVRAGGRPGVWFLSLDAASRMAVATARRLFHLPYFHASMSCRSESGFVRYASVRREPPSAGFRARYRPVGPETTAEPGTLAHWLTERYALYAAHPSGRIHTADIHHRPWPLREAEVEVEHDSMTAPFGIRTTGRPLLHFARRLDVVIWPLRPAGSARGS